MSKSENGKNLKVSIQGQFSGLLDGLDRLQKQVSESIFKKSKHRGSRNRSGRAKVRRRQGKVARRARRYNRRPTKRPKGHRKPR